MPMLPVSMPASSLRMSPNRFSVQTTSNWRGSRTSCMAQLSTSMLRISTSGWRAATRCATARHSRLLSSTLALSMECSRRRLPVASLKAYSTSRSTSSSV